MAYDGEVGEFVLPRTLVFCQISALKNLCDKVSYLGKIGAL
jgi:hypothetical protein